MNSNQLIRRGISYLSITGVMGLLLILANSFFFSALAAYQPDNLTHNTSEVGTMVVSSSSHTSSKLIPHLDFTPAVTLYLPIIFNPKPPAVSCNPSGGSGGLGPGAHETKVGDLNAVVVVSTKYDPQKPTYFAFYLHGDDGIYTKFLKPHNQIAKLVEEQGWVFVAPQSSQENIHWYIDADKQVEQLAEVFEEMFDQYNLCQDIIIGSSISGGSTFISGHFFPDKGKQYPIHMDLVCLGWTDQDARNKIKVLGQDPAVVARSSFKFTYGDQDKYLDSIENTIDVYRQAGFDVTVDEKADVSHCLSGADLNINQQIREDWKALIKRLNL